MKRLALVLVLTLSCMAVKCPPSTTAVVTAVSQAAIDDAALITALADPNLPPAQKPPLLAYAQAASVGVGEVSIVLASGGTATQMALQIASDLAPVVAPALPGLPAAIVTAVGQEAADIQAILAAYSAPAASPNVVGQAKVIHFGAGDLAKLRAAHAATVANQARIAGVKGK